MSLTINGVSKQFGGIKALQDCTLQVKEGSITALIGPNGSGKTTLFNVITRLLKEEEGFVRLGETSLTDLPSHDVALSGVSRTFQEVRLFKNLTIRDHLSIAMREDDHKLFKNLFSWKPVEEKKMVSLLKTVGLDKPLDTFATDLSYGQRKLLDLAVALAKPHKILMLDEPVAGVNPKLRDSIKAILRKLNQQGETILLIEHDMNFVMDLVDIIWVLDNGKVIAHGKPEAIRNNKHVLEAYLGA